MQPVRGIPMIKYTFNQLTCLYQLAVYTRQLAAAKAVLVEGNQPLVMGLSVM